MEHAIVCGILLFWKFEWMLHVEREVFFKEIKHFTHCSHFSIDPMEFE